MIYQIHPKHGRLMPVSKMEADINEKNGWKTVTEAEFYNVSCETKAREKKKLTELTPEEIKANFGENYNETEETQESEETEEEMLGTPAEQYAEEVAEIVNDEIPRSVLADLYEAKYGEKPHGRMKDETIKAKLEAE